MKHTARLEPPDSRVTVIIPAYNRARYIVQALESALGQTGICPDVIVVDDGSTDDTTTVLAPYLDRVRYVYQPNQGPAAARNHGLRLGQADYVAFLDSDDYYAPGALAVLHDALAARPAAGALQGAVTLVDESGSPLGVQEPWHEAPNLDLESCVRFMPAKLMAMMLRREWADRVGGFDVELRWGEDVDFLIRLVAAGCFVDWVRRPIACHRQHVGNMSRDAVRAAEGIVAVHDKYFARVDVPESLRRQEGTIRFYCLVWNAWRMSCTGQIDHVAEWLRRSLAYWPYPPEQSVIEWVKQFGAHDARIGRAATGAKTWLPAMRGAAQSAQVSWSRAETLFAWWVQVWSPYLDPNRGKVGFAAFGNVTTSALVALAQDCLAMTPAPSMLKVIARFWFDACAEGLVPSSRRSAVVALYLTAFGQAALARQYAIARHALWKAIRATSRPAAVGAWVRFLRRAVPYLVQRRDRVSPALPERAMPEPGGNR